MKTAVILKMRIVSAIRSDRQLLSAALQRIGINGAISELTYKKMYSDFLSDPKVRVPDPNSIAALAFIGGGMFLSRRRQSR
ncbi:MULTISPECIES: PEP-CTERM sorting domain-containing protein [Okeania]|uniref:PEP-CTERM sorting domain-containing protein n=2 Tax=Microcoleaceae TaxID=1892252 RepID=A0A3N6RSE8_9CYAN|nr:MULTISPECIES: PEP-CTERM sorting domain-containing protein [Okeania]NET95977.1 PEP-CTERM sorting domain-containing protein [Okeania sp. SIO1H2]NES78470.1 PEP-CTERM sorting domain-containing protein [Okeania sp. SIO1H4]NES89889.1 PEP-CTERM sorting domain-containing protein [Okeania sp. SIO2B9]NET21771.1 PEP-CTERM sorting domain-containing protein [Okeania sp. SIO1H5]NET78423.1 PEP-CTERM sorting domain-containing protein [Okeania sp. SIO1F9]